MLCSLSLPAPNSSLAGPPGSITVTGNTQISMRRKEQTQYVQYSTTVWSRAKEIPTPNLTSLCRHPKTRLCSVIGMPPGLQQPGSCTLHYACATHFEIKRLQLSRVVEKACRGNCCHTPTSGGPQQCNPPAESTAAESLQALPMAPSSPRPPQFKREHKRERHGPRI